MPALLPCHHLAAVCLPLAGPPTPPVTAGLVGWYTAHGLEPAINRLRDLSGPNNHATTVGVVTHNTGFTSPDILNGQPHLRGNTTASIIFPSAIMPVTYTLFHVTRYTGPARQRIVTSRNINHISGHWRGRSGLAYQLALSWITPESITLPGQLHGDDWVLSSDQPGVYRSQGVLRSFSTKTTFTQQIQLAVKKSTNSCRSD